MKFCEACQKERVHTHFDTNEVCLVCLQVSKKEIVKDRKEKQELAKQLQTEQTRTQELQNTFHQTKEQLTEAQTKIKELQEEVNTHLQALETAQE